MIFSSDTDSRTAREEKGKNNNNDCGDDSGYDSGQYCCPSGKKDLYYTWVPYTGVLDITKTFSISFHIF